jgi:DNA-binding CsgD family transcriptional regulator
MTSVHQQVIVESSVDGFVGWLRINCVPHMDFQDFKRQTIDAIIAHIDNPAVRTIEVTDLQKVITPLDDVRHDCQTIEQLQELCRELLTLVSTSSKTLVVTCSNPGEVGKPSAPASLEPLTKRERQVLTGVCDGLSAREIGKRLFISERTVETHIGNGYRKLGIRSRIELIKRASEFGF